MSETSTEHSMSKRINDDESIMGGGDNATTTVTTTELPSSKLMKVGCVGGGQLGRMMALEAPRLNISMQFLDPLGSKSPAALAGSHVIEGPLNDYHKLRELSNDMDVVTVEIEHVGVDSLEKLEQSGVNVQPSSRVIRLIQDKFTQKEHFEIHDIPLPQFMPTPTIDSIVEASRILGLPLMLKSRRGAYDGRGNAVLKDDSDGAIHAALLSLGVNIKEQETALDLYAEAWMDFKCELAVMVVQSVQHHKKSGDEKKSKGHKCVDGEKKKGEKGNSNSSSVTKAYPTVTAIQTDSICRVVLAPARDVPVEVRHEAERIASKAIASLGEGATGVFGVEMFLLKDNKTILLNEVAPRPHNTGHYTQDGCATSQFENHLRAITGLPLGDVNMSVGAAAMINILGAKSGSMEDTMKSANAAMSIPRSTVHMYSKGNRPGRKMGHINITADSAAELDGHLKTLLQVENIIDSILPQMEPTKRPTPLVGVIMGSHSDLPTMQAAVEILQKFNIPHEVDIVSAHRTPDKLMTYGRSAATRGLQVIIAGAGGAAHLPGMVAAMTPLPVIGVPIKTSTLNGQDSLLSIVQMPRGIPVATVAIGNAMNAGLLAVRMLCSSRPQLREQMESYQLDMKQMVDETSEKLLSQGSKQYLEGMANKNTSVNV